MPTSSMSKVMTMYMVFDALKKGKITMNTEFLVSEDAWRMQGSKMFVEVDKPIKVEDLVRGVIIQSGNDATVVLAEGISGTQDAFVAAMNQKATQLGMNDSHFMNSSGWPDPEHYSTAHDLSVMARAMIRDFPEYYPIFSEKEFTYHKITQANRNPLLYKNIGADGMKTGHTEDGGYGLIGSGTLNGRRVVFVLNGMESNKDRAQEGTKMLEYGLKSFVNEKLFAKNQKVADAPIAFGEQGTVPLVMGQDTVITHGIAGMGPVEAKLEYKSPLMAPVTRGQEIGILKVKIGATGASQSFPVYAGADVAKAGFIGGLFQKLKYMTQGQMATN